MAGRPSVPTSLAELVAPESTALVIWDMQVGIGAKAHNYPTLRAAMDRLLAAAWGRKVLVAWSRHVAPPLDQTPPAGLRTLMRRQRVDDPAQLKPFMQAGTPDVELIPGLTPRPGDLVLEKSTPSFFVGTPFELRMRARGITTLVLAGVSTESGIELTARHALVLGYFPVIVEDAVGSSSAEAHERALIGLRTLTDVATADSVIAVWRG